MLRKEAVIAQVRPLEKLWALAQGVARSLALGVRYLRVAFPWRIRHRLFDELGFGIALEGLAAIALSH